MSNLVHVFVSSTTQDLKSYREVVTGAVLSRGAHPVVKEHFAPSHRILADYLDAQLGQSDAVFCIVGLLYGGSPDHQEGVRRSWTQLEYDYAELHGIPLFVFLADDQSRFDCEIQQSTDNEELQSQFRKYVTQAGRKYEVFQSPEQLKDLILKIDYEEIRQASKQRLALLARQVRKKRCLGLAMVVAIATLLCGICFVVPQFEPVVTPGEFHVSELSVGKGCMQIPVQLVYSAKVGNKFAPFRVQSVISPDSTYRLPDDLRAAREAFSREQDAKKAAKEPIIWDGDVFQLKAWDLSHASDGEAITLVLQVETGKYFDFVITHLKLKEISVTDESGKAMSAYEKYVSGYDRESHGQPNPALSNMFGVSLTAVTSDGYVILHRRSKRNAVVPDFIHVSVAETTQAADPSVPNNSTDAEPDRGQLVYNTAVRGLKEELCIEHFDRERVEFLGLIYSPELMQFDLVGTVRLPFTAEEVQAMAKGGRDQTFENESLIVQPFNARAIAIFMQKEPNWSPFAAASILLALEFEFGSDSVDRDFVAVFGKHPVELRQFKFVPKQ